jgi:YHS domain-containing protein
MGNEIDREVHVDYKGVRIYFCCPPCIKKFEADPEKYVSALPTAMQEKLRHSSAKESGHD